MTFLSACQSAALRIISRKPQSMFNANDLAAVEIADIANDVAVSIAQSQDWQALTKFGTITGDGVLTQFALPDDYDRMVQASEQVDPNNWFWGYFHVPTVTDWLKIESYGYEWLTPGAWIILENQFNFAPAPGDGQQAKYPYISKNIVKPDSGPNKPSFTMDTDTFVLNERLLTLGTIWRWKEQKGLEYAEDMQTYEIALSQQQARDAGGRVVRSAPRAPSGRFSVAFPWTLGQP